jgi:hypothetical protein
VPTMTARQKLLSMVPTVGIIVAGACAALHIVDGALALIVQAGLVGYVLGKARVVFAESERERREAIRQVEGFIAWLHGKLNADEVPLTRRESAEHALEAATMSLDLMERSAPPWTRWRERRARERAAR